VLITPLLSPHIQYGNPFSRLKLALPLYPQTTLGTLEGDIFAIKENLGSVATLITSPSNKGLTAVCVVVSQMVTLETVTLPMVGCGVADAVAETTVGVNVATTPVGV
jgi:hypothetical protein